ARESHPAVRRVLPSRPAASLSPRCSVTVRPARPRHAEHTTPVRFSGQKVSTTARRSISGADDREKHGGRGAALGRALERDGASVFLHNALTEREADAGATGLGGEEDLEYAWQHVGGDRRPAVVESASPHPVRKDAGRQR